MNPPPGPEPVDGVVAAVVVGGGPYDLAPVGGVPSVVRAVRALAGVAREVLLCGPAARVAQALEACRGLAVRAGDPGSPGPADAVVVLHEAIRPLAPPSLARAVRDAVRAGAPSAVPVLPLTDTVKQVSDGVLGAGPERATLRVVQSPVAFRAGLLPTLPAGASDVVARSAAAGTPAHTVPGHPAAFALRSDWDLEVAEMVLDGVLHGLLHGRRA